MFKKYHCVEARITKLDGEPERGRNVLNLDQRIHDGLEGFKLGNRLLGRLLVVPEAGVSHLLLDLLDLFLPASTVKDCLRAQQSSVAGFLPGNRDSHPWSNLSTKRQHRLAVEAAQYNEKPFSGKCRPL